MTRTHRPRQTKEIIRFWWTIYRELTCNQRMRRVLGLEVALRHSRSRYQAWGTITAQTEFEEWWKEHRTKFIEEPSIQELSDDTIVRKPKHLYVSINLEKSVSRLLAALKGHIQRGQTKQGLEAIGQKRKFRRQASVRYNERVQIHLPTFREEYRFFKYVYAPLLFGPTDSWIGDEGDAKGAGIKLWKKTEAYYRGKKKPKFLQGSVNGKPTPSALRTLRRYVQRLKLLCGRVAFGKFP